MSTTPKERQEVMLRLTQNGIDYETARQLRRISIRLQRWFELECGDGNEHGSWGIERDDTTETPFMVHHHYMHGRGKDYTTRMKIADRETGARKRLDKIMSGLPDFVPYIQTDPRGCALYLVRKSDLKPGDQLDCVYTRGIAVY